MSAHEFNQLEPMGAMRSEQRKSELDDPADSDETKTRNIFALMASRHFAMVAEVPSADGFISPSLTPWAKQLYANDDPNSCESHVADNCGERNVPARRPSVFFQGRHLVTGINHGRSCHIPS